MIARAIAFLRERGASIAVEGIVNFIGPYVIYALTKKDLGEVGALMASSAPPIIWSLIEFARHRRVDALSILVLAGIALSLLAFLGGGGPKFLQMRERMVTALIGLAFVVSALNWIHGIGAFNFTSPHRSCFTSSRRSPVERIIR